MISRRSFLHCSTLAVFAAAGSVAFAVEPSAKEAAQVRELFVLLAAANKAVNQLAHNRMATRSLAAELIYSLSPSRSVSGSV